MSERYGKGSAERIGSLWVLHLKGTSFERGLQHGTLMRYRARDTINFYRNLPYALAAGLVPERLFKMTSINKLKNTMVRRLYRNRDPDVLEEIRGLAVGLGLKMEDLAEVLVLSDIIQVAGAMAERRRKGGPRALPGYGCTSAVCKTPPDSMIFGRNFDFWGAGYWDANPAVIFHHPDKGKAFCSIGTAGLPTGGVTSINEDGLTVALHQHGSRDSSPKGTPIINIVHKIIRSASTVEEALQIADDHRATGGWSLVLAGGSPPQAAVLEMSYALQRARWLEGVSLTASNFFADEELKSREIQANLSSTISDHLRFKRASELAASTLMKPVRMAGILGDHYDLLAGRERSAGFSISRITTISSVVFSLPDRRFWVSEAGAPSSKGGYVGFDLDNGLGGARSTTERIEGGKPPPLKITAAQDRYLDAYKEYFGSGDLNRILMILGECASLDPSEPTFPLVEGIVRLIVGNYRGALSSVNRSLELENIELKKKVTMLWKARVMDLLDRRDQSLKIYEGLSGESDNPHIIVKSAGNGLQKPFNEKELAGLMIDFANGEAIE